MYTSGTSKLGLSRILSSPFTEGALLVPELPSKVCSVLPSVVSLLGTTTCSYCLVPHIVHAMYLPSNCGSWGFSRRLGTSSPRCHTFRNVVFPSDFSNSLYQVSILWVKNLWDIRGFLSRSIDPILCSVVRPFFFFLFLYSWLHPVSISLIVNNTYVGMHAGE